MTTLKNTLHDSNNGLDYTLVNDHYLPNLTGRDLILDCAKVNGLRTV